MPPTDEVYIWLGVSDPLSLALGPVAKQSAQANTMLSYPMDEAETLLDGRLSDAKKSLENCEEDLECLREQITVCPRPMPSCPRPLC